MNINNNFSKNKNHFKGVNPCNYITIHDTGNTSRGANALNHAKFINNGSSSTWHYTVDESNIVQHFPDSIQCWHAGDGKGKGNTESIGIEMCINSDGNFSKTVDNTVELVLHLMNKHNIPINRVVQHNKWTGKNCPNSLRHNRYGITWYDFITKVKSKMGTEVKPEVKPDNNSNKLYRVQVGAFKNKENAVELEKKLNKLGFSTYIKYD